MPSPGADAQPRGHRAVVALHEGGHQGAVRLGQEDVEDPVVDDPAELAGDGRHQLVRIEDGRDLGHDGQQLAEQLAGAAGRVFASEGGKTGNLSTQPGGPDAWDAARQAGVHCRDVRAAAAPAARDRGHQAILPHRYPFLLVDRILELEEDRRVLAVKNVSSDERYFIAGPGGRPVLPASILTEAMAQAGAVLILAKPENRSRLIYFMGIDRVRYRRPVSAGDSVLLEGTVVRLRGAHGQPARRGPRGRPRGLRGADDVRARRAARLGRPMRPPRGAPGGRPPHAPTGGTRRPPLPGPRALEVRRLLARGGRPLDRGRPRAGGRPRRALPAAPHRSRAATRCASTAAASATTPSAIVLAPPQAGRLHHVARRSRAAGRPSTTSSATSAAGCSRSAASTGTPSGLLVLTNDHRLGQRLTDPEAHVPKRYHVLVARRARRADALRALREGVPLGDGTVVAAGAASARWARPRGGRRWLEIVLTEGKNRQVRRMCASVGHDVRELTRVAVGGLELGDLPSGQWRAGRARWRLAGG